MLFRSKGIICPLPELSEVEDLDKPGFKYPIISGEYKLGENIHSWASEPIIPGTPISKPSPVFEKIPPEAEQEELARFQEMLDARKAKESKRLEEEKKKIQE